MNRTIWIGAIRAVAMVVALPVVVQVLGQGVATAATIPPSSVSTVSVSTEFDTRTSKLVVATCPANKRIVGGGAQVVGETQHVVLTRQEPVVVTSGDRYEVEAIKDPIGPTTTWSLTAFAFCADPPPGLEIVRTSIATNRASDVAGASCPRGKSVVGMGGRITGGENREILATSGVLPVAFAHASNPFSGLGHPYILTASAVCVTAAVMSDLQVVSGDSGPTSPAGRQFAQATCPAGMRATGGAAFAVPPVVIESVLPDPSRTQIQAVARNDGAAPGGSVRVFAFCAS